MRRNLSLLLKVLARIKPMFAAFALLLLVVCASTVFATKCFADSAYSFTALQYPGAQDTSARGINDSGTVSGSFTLDGIHGYILTGATYSPYDVPGTSRTSAYHINKDGEVVGQFLNSEDLASGFRMKDGAFKVLTYPGAKATWAWGINDSGMIVGYFLSTSGTTSGFVLDNNIYTPINYPEARATMATAINNQGTIVGWYETNDAVHGFFLHDGVYSPVIYPDSTACLVHGINDEGTVVGEFTDAADKLHGFILKDGEYIKLDYPDSDVTRVYAINNHGTIVGWYRTVSDHGAFKATLASETVFHALTVATSGTGVGSITSSPPGVNCGGTCTANYAEGTSVILTATPDTGSVFTGWSGGCSGIDSCTVSMTSDVTVTATFKTAIPPKISVAPSSVNFGRIKRGATLAKSVRIKNIGNLDLGVGSPSIDNAQFSITNDGCAAPIAKGLFCVMEIQFAPTAYGKTTASLSIPSNDTRVGKSPYLVKLKGEAPPPKITVPTSVAMGKVLTTALPVKKTITVKNTGLSDLTITSVTLTGDTAFYQTNTCEAGPIAKGVPCSITIAFDPTTIGPATATLGIVSNDPASSTKTVILKGTGK